MFTVKAERTQTLAASQAVKTMWPKHASPTQMFKGVLLCFFTFWILVRVQCVYLGIKRSTKLQISKSTPKGDILFLKNPFSRTTTNGSFGLQSCFPVFVTSQILNPAYRNSNGWGVENAWLSTARFKIENRCWCFYITVFRKFWMSFSFHLAYNVW